MLHVTRNQLDSCYLAIPEKNRVILKTYILFWNPHARIFLFFYITLEIPDKTELHTWKFHKIVLDPWEIPRPKTKTPGNSTLFFFWSPLEISLRF